MQKERERRGKDANEELREGSFNLKEFGENEKETVFEAEDFACKEILNEEDLNRLATSRLRAARAPTRSELALARSRLLSMAVAAPIRSRPRPLRR